MEKFIVNKKIDLKNFLAEKLGISKSKAKEIIDTRNVLVNNRIVWIANHKLKIGDTVEIPSFDFHYKKSFSVKDSILYEDDFIVAVQKPPFLESNKSKNSVEFLLQQYKNDRKIEAIHRLDRETSGVMLFAKNKKVFYRFKELWLEKKVKKIYLAISYGSADFKRKVVNITIQKKYAKSEVSVVSKNERFTLFKVDLKTGRKHQIRIHLSKIGFPIVGDKIYGVKIIENSILKKIKRHMLHAYEISFIHPFIKKKTVIKAPVYPDFKRVVKLLKLKLYNH